MSPFRSLYGAILFAAGLASCGPPAAAPADPARLPALFDCVREVEGILISAHRGAPVTGFAENALSTLKHGHANGLRVFEVDVSRSKDGALFLLHDRTLQRTTTGSGAAVNWNMDEIDYLQLVTVDGVRLDESPPRLAAVLDWAIEQDVILQLDRKDSVAWSQLINAVRAARAESYVVLISYNDDETIEIAGLAPDLMISASVDSRDHQAELEASGVDSARLIAWTGTRRPSPAAWRALAHRGIESAFGTLGRPETRLDAQYIADGNLSEYQDLADQGLHVLGSDEANAVADYLTVDDRTIEACWR